MTTTQGTLGRYLAWFLAALSLGAGAIHFAEAGPHFDFAWYHGAFFAGVAWLQLAWAAAVVLRPSVRLLGLGLLGNLGVIAVWSVSRVWGVPVPPEPFTPEPVTFASVLATGFQGAIVIAVAAILARPSLAQRSLGPTVGLAGLGSTAAVVAVFASLSLSPAFAEADGHAHAPGGDTASSESSDEPRVDTRAALIEQGGDAILEQAGDPSAEVADADGHDHGDVAASPLVDGSTACEQADASAAGNHGQRGPVLPEPMTPEERETYQEQVRQANQLVEDHPTVADVEAGGWTLLTPYVPCIGAHYINWDYLNNGEFDPARPEIILTAGQDPDDLTVGLSYLRFSPEHPEYPNAFAGNNDPWHVHQFLCVRDGRVVGDEDIGQETCEEDRGGTWTPLGNLWMNHMWNVPGWESPWGLFSSEHPDLGGSVGNFDS